MKYWKANNMFIEDITNSRLAQIKHRTFVNNTHLLPVYSQHDSLLPNTFLEHSNERMQYTKQD